MSFTLRKETNLYDTQAIEKGMLDKIDTVLTDVDMFNRLIHYGQSDQVDAIKMIDGKMYVSMTYLKTGTLKLGGQRDTNGLMEVYDAGNNLVGKWSVDGIAIKKGSLILNEGNTTTEFKIDTDGTLSVGYGTFTVSNAGVVTMKKGSITLNEGNATTEFKVNSNGSLSVGSGSFVVANTGAVNIGTGAFQITPDGSVTITKGTIQINTGTSMFEVNSSGQLSVGGGDFQVSNSGQVTISNRGSIKINTNSSNVTAFTVTSAGALTSRSQSTNNYLTINNGTLAGGIGSTQYGRITFTGGQQSAHTPGATYNALFIVGQPAIVLKGRIFTNSVYNQAGNSETMPDGWYWFGDHQGYFANGLLCDYS